jgi:glycosyltransferase involved in cell wall biosynthesis
VLIESAGVSMNYNPLVSVVVRTKDRPKLLRKAIQSIAGQTYRPIQVVLVNDGGCDLNLDDLQGILGDVAVCYIRLETNTGRGNAGNIGIENAQGKYVGFLDDDDEYYPEHLITLVSFLEQSDYEVAYTDSLMVYKEYNPQTRELNDSVKREVVFSQDFIYDKLVFENYIPLMCLLFKRDLFVASGGFDNGFELYEDWDLLIRIGRKHPFYHIKQVTANYNQWSVELQISQRNRDAVFLQQAYMKVLLRHIEEITPQRVHGIVSDYVYAKQCLKDLRNESESQKNQISERAAQIEALSAGIGERDAKVSALAAALEEKTSRLGGLEDELKEQARQIETLSAVLGERDAQIIALTAELGAKVCRIGELEGELRERAARIEALSAGIGERDIQINAFSSELGAKASRIGDLENELKERDARLRSLISLMAGKEADIISLRSGLQDRDSLIILMKNTRGWRILEKYRRVRDRVIAPLFGMRRENTEK